MKSRRDESSKEAAKAAEEFAARAMEEAEEAIRRADMRDEDVEDSGPAKCFAIFKAEGFGMLEAMSQVHDRDGLLCFCVGAKGCGRFACWSCRRLGKA